MSTLNQRLAALRDALAAEFSEIDAQIAALSISAGAVTPQQYGAVADGVTDDSAAFVAALAALKAQALNKPGFYGGSGKLFIPAGHYYMGTTVLDVTHTLIIEGEGSGRYGPGAGGCTHLRWAHGTSGIRIQGANTNGNTGVDTDPNTHDGAGGVFLKHMCLEGGYVATEGEYHGLVIRNVTTAEDLYIKNWSGDGVKGWAGSVIGFGAVGGNVSMSMLLAVRCEGNRVAFDFRGDNANIVTLINCESYANRQAGYIGDNGAGATTVQGMHCASNGDVSGAIPTKCTSSSKWYAAKWGGDFTIAPSGTTADTADWLYVSAGAVDATHPAHTATPSTFRAGGDYVTLDSDTTTFVVPYSEGNGFSQFNNQALILNPTMIAAQHRGGNVMVGLSDGIRFRLPVSNPMRLESRTGETGVWAMDVNGTVFGYTDYIQGGPALVNGDTGVQMRVATTPIVDLDSTGFNLASGKTLRVNGTQVVTARQTGTPADATDLATALTLVNALKAKLVTHGLIS